MSVTQVYKNDREITLPEQVRITIGTALILRRRDMRQYRADEVKANRSGDYWAAEVAAIDDALRAIGYDPEAL